GFARDVERFLNHEPVAAGPPSAAYRLRKFVRRNRGPVAAACLVLLALLLGFVGTTWGLVRAERAARKEREANHTAQAGQANAERASEVAKAEQKKAEQERDAKEQALRQEKRERRYAQAISDFVRDDFLALTSVEGQDRFGGEGDRERLSKDTTLRELLDRAA